MSGDSIGRKLVDLRVFDLKEELEKRSLEITGNKNVLLERLQKALKDEGHDPDTYVFEALDKRGTPKKVAAKAKTEKAAAEEEVIEIKEEVEDVKDDSEENQQEGDEVVDEVGTVDEEYEDEEYQEEDNNDGGGNDNEESINLTIEEDEQKLLHAQAADDKDKNKSGKQTSGGADGSGGDGDDNEKADEEGEKQDNDVDGDGDGDDKKESEENAVEGGDKKKGKGDDEKNKNDDSEQKSSAKSATSKDEKDKSTSGTKSKSSSSSRNLWVSGLSSLTRASDLKTIFSKYGKVIGAKVVTNTRTPGTRCYGYVTMSSSADASKCIEHLHGTELHGRIISVERTKSEIGSSSQSSKPDSRKPTSKSRDREKDKNGDKATEKNGDGKKDAGDKAKSETRRSLHNRARTSRDRNRSDRRRSTDRERDKQREVLSFQKIREERERQRLREKERELREEDRRRREIRRRQREEEQRLHREREKLQLERERLEREKAELLRLERERQKLEREKIELERLELKRQQMKIMQSSRLDDTKRPIKRPSDDRYSDADRKRTASDRRFEPPPPPRFDSSMASRAVSTYDRSSDKKRDEYGSSKRDDYKRDLDVSRHSSNYQSSRDSHKDGRYSDGDPRSSNFRRGDDRDGGRSSGSKRFEGAAYPERPSTGSGAQWHNSGPPAMKSFTGNSMPSAGGGGMANWKTDSHWRPVESSHDRYDRTYNERSGGQYMEPSRPSLFVGRPQDRYGGQASSRYENGKY